MTLKRFFSDTKKIKWSALVLFAGLYALVSYFHEPWFDEAQAWQIAKCASFHDILFEIPHYECHPPLWHLILAVPAKLGLDYSFSLKAIGFIISCSSAAIVLFRTALPLWARVGAVFGYFFFYQYGVVVRPYGLMILLFLILSLTLPERDERPWLNFAVLTLICLSSAYGLLLAGGICACVLWDLFKEKGVKKLFSQLFTDPRTLSLLVIFAEALLICAQIVPRADTYNSSFSETNPVIPRFLCALLTLPGESLLTTASWFDHDGTLLQTVSFTAYELVALCALGAFIWLLIVCAASQKGLKYLVVPYLFFSVFSAAVYLSGHHLGIVFILLLFWAQFTASDPEKFRIGKKLAAKIAKTERDGKLLRRFYALAAALCVCVPAFWSAAASVNDLRYPYCYSRDLAVFLKDNGLSDALILSGWGECKALDAETGEYEKFPNTFVVSNIVPVNAYFDRNLAFNLNYGEDSGGFIYYRNASVERSASDVAKWREAGIPGVLIGRPDLSEVYGDEISYSDYSLVAAVGYRFIWKTSARVSYMPVYLRSDLLEKYSLEPLSGLEYAFINGITLTDEMREQLENGVPIEEILKPYLDAMFGENN